MMNASKTRRAESVTWTFTERIVFDSLPNERRAPSCYYYYYYYLLYAIRLVIGMQRAHVGCEKIRHHIQYAWILLTQNIYVHCIQPIVIIIAMPL